METNKTRQSRHKMAHTILFPWIEHLYFYCMTTVKQLFLLQEALALGVEGRGGMELMGDMVKMKNTFRISAVPEISSSER